MQPGLGEWLDEHLKREAGMKIVHAVTALFRCRWAGPPRAAARLLLLLLSIRGATQRQNRSRRVRHRSTRPPWADRVAPLSSADRIARQGGQPLRTSRTPTW